MDKCKLCQTVLVRITAWQSMTPAERATARAAGKNRYGGRGLCPRCYRTELGAGRLEDWPPFRELVPRRDVLEDWRLLADRSMSRAQNVRLLAPRMGMSESALEKALDRAVRDGELAA